MTKKEQGLLKGAIRRTFSRSELRKKILDSAHVKDYHDPNRKRVTRWGRCASCNTMTPLYLLEIDHLDPIIPVGETLQDQSWDKVVDSVWCDERRLQALCESCHNKKSQEENSERRRIKKENTKK